LQGGRARAVLRLGEGQGGVLSVVLRRRHVGVRGGGARVTSLFGGACRGVRCRTCCAERAVRQDEACSMQRWHLESLRFVPCRVLRAVFHKALRRCLANDYARPTPMSASELVRVVNRQPWQSRRTVRPCSVQGGKKKFCASVFEQLKSKTAEAKALKLCGKVQLRERAQLLAAKMIASQEHDRILQAAPGPLSRRSGGIAAGVSVEGCVRLNGLGR